MKVFASLVALPSLATAHYVFPALINNGAATTQWEYVRQWTGYYSNGPVTDVSSLSIRCNVDGATKSASTLDVAAGSTVGFTAVSSITHPGTLQAYMAKVPAGQTAATWDGSGNVWFKIFGQGPTLGGSSLVWPSEGATQVSFKIPASLPSGQYLFRVEHIALHSASASGGAQFYISCGQINLTGGGSGTPTNLVAFPGAYKATDPGIMLNIYYPVVSRPFSSLIVERSSIRD
ncbi:putative endo-beta-1,4-glucanase D [Lachnellula suecica]|uniref:lytic cellulose monooxygenase (C4-dehydrogenating) n=1 Tax=Lachnellula suecica TaxID=602035 RepID=A0A8T9CHF9_9HELO|nr:putative endo-beta-1,4-glucanase D [Lachnellula suecica]